MRCRIVILSLVSLVVLTGAAPASPAPPAGCSDFNQPKCTIELSTGITMRYLEFGSPAAARTVFLLHGYTDSSRTWERVVPALERQLPGADIVVPDLRGHGDSSMPAGPGCPAAPASCFQWSQFAADIIAFMDARHIQRAAVVGHSVGTLVAQELGFDYPDRVSRLVLISTAATGQEPAVGFLLNEVVDGLWEQAFTSAGYNWPDGVYNLTPGVAAPGFDDFLDQEWVVSAVAPNAFLDQLRTDTETIRLGTWIGALDAAYAVDNTERLEHLAVPTLVLYGIQDAIFSPSDEQTLIDALTVAAHNGGSFWWKEYGVLPPPPDGSQTDLAHNLPWEAPDGVAADIAAFILRGKPTTTLYHTNYPASVQQVVAEPDRATLIHEP